MLAVDVDDLDANDLTQLQKLGRSGLARVFIGLGDVTGEMRRALRITDVVPRPFGSEKLRKIITGLDSRDTAQIRPVAD